MRFCAFYKRRHKVSLKISTTIHRWRTLHRARRESLCSSPINWRRSFNDCLGLERSKFKGGTTFFMLQFLEGFGIIRKKYADIVHR